MNKSKQLLRILRKSLHFCKLVRPWLKNLVLLNSLAEMAAFMNIRSVKFYPERKESRNEEYHGLYRFSAENVEWIANLFLEPKVETRGGALSPKKQMQIFLRFLSDPGFQIGIGKEEGVHRTTICKTISHVLPKIVEKAGIWIKFPTENSTDQAINEWAQVYRFPCAFGAIDCTHVPIIKPSLHGDEYINRKGWCSINVQATCDGKEMFTSVDAQWPGSVHDSRILKRSNIFGKMRKRQQNGLILGDEGYGITPWLLTPYRNPTTPQEIAYNTLHKRERVIIERCFGQLKRRFPVLQHQIRLNIDKIPSVIVSAVVLHNVAKYLNDQLPNDEEEVAAEDHDGEEVVEDNDELNNDRQRGQQRREEIKNIIFQLQL